LRALAVLLLVFLAAGLLLAAGCARAFADAGLAALPTFGAALLTTLVSLLASVTFTCHIDVVFIGNKTRKKVP
jgi:hypothetical protein